MHNVLLFAPSDTVRHLADLKIGLSTAGYSVAYTNLNQSPESADLSTSFDGRPPDVIVADLTSVPDFFPMRELERSVKRMWGDDVPSPARIILLKSGHLRVPDWSLYTDDFLLPPYDSCEMLSRIELMLYRKRNVRSSDTLAVADLVLDLASGRADDTAGKHVSLTPREYELLRFLVTHRGKFFARDRLLDMVWGVDFEGGERTVDIHVRRLRAKLPPLAADLLETRRGIGYGIRNAFAN